jgi:hypothetical protein
LDNLTAISGEIPRFPFTSSDKVVRVTPSAAAASVMVKLKGSMHWRSTKPPGWGGFFIGMVQFLSVVIEIINIQRITVSKAKDYSPVCANRRGPKSSELAFERMQPETGQVHIGDTAGSIEPRENVTQPFLAFAHYAAWVIVFMKAFQTLMADRPVNL